MSSALRGFLDGIPGRKIPKVGDRARAVLDADPLAIYGRRRVRELGTVRDRVSEPDHGDLKRARDVLNQRAIDAAMARVQPDLGALAGEPRLDVSERVLLLRGRIFEEEPLPVPGLERGRVQARANLERDVHPDCERLNRPLECNEIRVRVGEQVDPSDARLRPLLPLGRQENRRPERREAVALERVHDDIGEIVGGGTPPAFLDRVDLLRQAPVRVRKVRYDAELDGPGWRASGLSSLEVDRRGLSSDSPRPRGRGVRPPPSRGGGSCSDGSRSGGNGSRSDMAVYLHSALLTASRHSRA